MQDIGIYTYATFLLDQNKCKLVQNSIVLQINRDKCLINLLDLEA